MGLLDFLRKNKKEAAATRRVEGKPIQPSSEPKAAPVKAKESKSQKPLKSDTKNAYKVLLKPLITEKATSTGTYYFAVAGRTNKQEIKKAIKALYGVDPVRVNIVNFGGKAVRWGRQSGQTKAWKKAIIYLKAGQTIEVFEGV